MIAKILPMFWVRKSSMSNMLNFLFLKKSWT